MRANGGRRDGPQGRTSERLRAIYVMHMYEKSAPSGDFRGSLPQTPGLAFRPAPGLHKKRPSPTCSRNVSCPHVLHRTVNTIFALRQHPAPERTDRTQPVTADELLPTPELLAAVQAERQRVEALIESLHAEHDGLVEEIRAIERKLHAALERHRQLGHVLGEEDAQPALWKPEPRELLARRAADKEDDGLLRGAAIRAAAVRAALADDEPARPRHYREWLDLVEASGDRIDGRDPAATLLTQLSRCPLIVRSVEPGTYQLDPGALDRLGAKRDTLHAAASAKVSAAAAKEYDAIDLAHALAPVEAEVRRTNKAITEAIALAESLGAADFFSGSFARATAIAAGSAPDVDVAALAVRNRAAA